MVWRSCLLLVAGLAVARRAAASCFDAVDLIEYDGLPSHKKMEQCLADKEDGETKYCLATVNLMNKIGVTGGFCLPKDCLITEIEQFIQDVCAVSDCASLDLPNPLAKELCPVIQSSLCNPQNRTQAGNNLNVTCLDRLGIRHDVRQQQLESVLACGGGDPQAQLDSGLINDLGDYDGCQKLADSHYCLATYNPLPVASGQCVPRSCSSDNYKTTAHFVCSIPDCVAYASLIPIQNCFLWKALVCGEAPPTPPMHDDAHVMRAAFRGHVIEFPALGPAAPHSLSAREVDRLQKVLQGLGPFVGIVNRTNGLHDGAGGKMTSVVSRRRLQDIPNSGPQGFAVTCDFGPPQVDSGLIGFICLTGFLLMVGAIAGAMSYYAKTHPKDDTDAPGGGKALDTLGGISSSARDMGAVSSSAGAGGVGVGVRDVRVDRFEASVAHQAALSTRGLLEGQKEEDSMGYKLLMCFDPINNWNKMFSLKTSDKSLSCLNGVRVLSLSWIILAHILVAEGIAATLKNIQVVGGLLQRFSFQTIIGGFFAVDSFFYLSGFLTAYTVTNTTRTKTRGKLPVGMAILHRYVRLTPVYLFVIFFWDKVAPYLALGPRWPLLSQSLGGVGEGSACEKYWWSNALYINNFVPSDFGQQCLPWSWYLANDFQFFLVGIIILWAYFHIHKLVGWLTIGATAVAASISTYIIVTQHHFEVSLTQGVFAGQADPNNNQMTVYYQKPWCRILPYLVGMAAGLLWAEHRGDVREAFGKMRGVGRWAGSILAGALMLFLIYIQWTANKDHPVVWTQVENSLFLTFSRGAWAVGLTWYVYLCALGHAPITNFFLSWGFWSPLARVTYSSYLIHLAIILMWFFARPYQEYYYDGEMYLYVPGFIFISYVTAIFISLLVEAPVMNLEKHLLAQLSRLGRRTRSTADNDKVGPLEEASMNPSTEAGRSPTLMTMGSEASSYTPLDKPTTRLNGGSQPPPPHGA
ncbi:unnamed protein product [Vitrella brassicaformis CCMP3155]|uniref:Acyltransferase 3 domain-containing protein n=1 Tax=Vitrella brassicaformis (strain CCMP3155) TaxID=1169540 RepID=A0A0G4FPM2_VITBC|nr:unnamed protein product [Vitrella brassicaformis CCMP3155]|eukprot:CEM15783.1 unnamed protein product [Vitrella brassicaformis CCMP3155]